MAAIKLISETEATGKVKEIYEENMATLGIDFVLFSGFNKLVDGLRVEPDEKPWYG